MAGPKKGDDDDFEVFTDLQGNPDKDDQSAADQLDALAFGADDEISDDDLEVSQDDGQGGKAAAEDDGQDDGQGDDDQGGADDGQGDDGEAELEADPGVDPKDIEIITLRSEMLEGRENTAKGAKDRAEQDLKDAEDAMLAAKEAGDSKADVEASKKFAKATVALQTAENNLVEIGTAKRQLAGLAQALIAKLPKDAEGKPVMPQHGARPAPRREATGRAPTQQGSKLAPTFFAKNKWFNDPKFKAQRATLLGLDSALKAEGKLDMNSPAWFDELGKRFNKVYPGVYKNLDGKPVATGERRRGVGTQAPGEGGGGGQPARQQQGGKVMLTNNDLSLMRKFGMDPENKDHRKNWLIEKRAAAAQEARA